MLEINHSCETPQQRQRWHVCVLPQATGMPRGSMPRQELLESKAGFSNTKTQSGKQQSKNKKNKLKKPQSYSSCEKPFNHFYSTTKAWLEQ